MSKQFDLEEFKAFVASKPADEEYDALDLRGCALAQAGYPDVEDTVLEEMGIPEAVYDATMDDPLTFGALADRLSTLTDPTP